MIALEHKRSERSARPFALLLMETGSAVEANSEVGTNHGGDFAPNEGAHKDAGILLDLLAILQPGTRETDLMGWYGNGASVGVLFTEIMSDDGLILNNILARVNATLRQKLTPQQFGEIKFSCQLFPEALRQLNPVSERIVGLPVTEDQADGKPIVNRVQPRIENRNSGVRRPLRVMKFGGTSVGNAECIRRVVEITRAAALEGGVAIVVSAMSGVTNRLIEAANFAKTGNESAATEVMLQLKQRHREAVKILIHSADERHALDSKMEALFAEGERLCHETSRLRELTPRTLDAISGLGERLCAPMVAAALEEAGVRSRAIEASSLIVTDSYHGGAEPRMQLTRARCQTRAFPVLEEGIVPVITGFIGATEEGVPTTLGRGGSDYSATIIGAALGADEVVIWTDVSGLLTADPKLVDEARIIPEISYREAAELAHFGAKVLHPKTLRPVMQSGIPVWIRNTFEPEDGGTQVTPAGPPTVAGVKALTVLRDASLITVTGITAAGNARHGVQDVPGRALAAAEAVRADVLLLLQPSANEIRLVVESSTAERTVEAMRREFFSSPRNENEKTVSEAPVSVITLVGQNLRIESDAADRTLAALGQESVHVIAKVAALSGCSLSFVVGRVVAQQELNGAMAAIHRELRLDGQHEERRPVSRASRPSTVFNYRSEHASAD
ncbi:MAG TPA: aspartate kinase [Terriglobales bacterium]|nr:aspartate kinase [Terriglobales bacterium]